MTRLPLFTVLVTGAAASADIATKLAAVRKGVVYFWVWEDSFEWYFRFQKFAEEKGFENGWTPMAQDSTLTFGGGGGGPVQ